MRILFLCDLRSVVVFRPISWAAESRGVAYMSFTTIQSRIYYTSVICVWFTPWRHTTDIGIFVNGVGCWYDFFYLVCYSTHNRVVIFLYLEMRSISIIVWFVWCILLKELKSSCRVHIFKMWYGKSDPSKPY